MMASTLAGTITGDTSSSFSMDQIVNAVNIILNPSSSSADRNAAHNLCETIKAHPSALAYGFQLATLEMPLPARLFGLNLLEEYIKTRLNVLQDAVELRDKVWGLLSLVVAVRPEERRLMQDKTAMLVAQLAMRIWPQYWPDFFDSLLKLVANSGTDLESDPSAVVRSEMGLLMARMVVDEIHPREGVVQKLIWDDARRPELQKALSIVLPMMMEKLYILLPHCSQWPLMAMSKLGKLLETMLEAFGSITLWTPLQNKPTIKCILAILSISMTCPDLTTTALEVLIAIAPRGPRPQEVDLVMELFDSILEPLQQTFSTFANEENYDHFKKLVDFIVTLAVTNMGHKKSPCIPKKFDLMLDLMLQLLNYPSLLVASTVGLFWNAIAKSDRLMTHEAVISRLPSLFLCSLVTLAKDQAVERKKSVYNLEDFTIEDKEADDDFEALFSTFKNRTMDLLRQLSFHHSTTFASYCYNALGTFIKERGGLDGGNGLVQQLAPAQFGQWDALMHATDAVLKACHARLVNNPTNNDDGNVNDPNSNIKIAEQVNNLANLLCVSINARAMHAETLCLWFVSLRMLTPCLGRINSPIFSPLMQQLFSLAFDFTSNVASLQFAIRARSSSTILKVCQIHPSLFIPALDYLIGLFQERSSSSTSIVNSDQKDEMSRQQKLLTEMLLMITGGVEGSAHRVELVKLVLAPLIKKIEEAASSLAGGYQSLLCHCGLAALAGGVGGVEIAAMTTLGEGGADGKETSSSALFKRSFCNLVSHLYIVIGYLKKLGIAGDIKSIINQFVPPVATFLLQSIKCIHAAFDPRNFSSQSPMIFEQWKIHFGEDALAGSGEGAISMEKSLDGGSIVDNIEQVSGKSLRGWLYMLRISLYMNYGVLYTLAPSLFISNTDPLPIANLFETSEVFTLTQWMHLTKHLACPILLDSHSAALIRTRRDSLYRVILLLVEKFGCVQLEAAWQTFRSLAGSNVAVKINDLERENAQETLLSTASSTLLALLYDLLVPIEERDKRTDPNLDITQVSLKKKHEQQQPSPLLATTAASSITHSAMALWMMEDTTISVKVLAVLDAMLRWKPTLAISKVSAILLRWLPHLMMSRVMTHHEVIFNSILGQLLAALSSTLLTDHHPAVIALLTELYKWQLYHGYDVFDRQIYSLALPNSNQIVQNLREYFTNFSATTATVTPPNIKSQRTLIKTSLVKAIQQHALSSVDGVISTVPKLPDRLVVLKKLRADKDTGADANFDLASFFDQ